MKCKPITSATAKGLRPYQEDRFFMSAMQEGTLVGVFDGHGGDDVSHLASQEFPAIFAVEIGVKGASPRSALEASVQKLNIMTHHLYPGSTMSVVYIPTKGRAVTAA